MEHTVQLVHSSRLHAQVVCLVLEIRRTLILNQDVGLVEEVCIPKSEDHQVLDLRDNVWIVLLVMFVLEILLRLNLSTTLLIEATNVQLVITALQIHIKKQLVLKVIIIRGLEA